MHATGSMLKTVLESIRLLLNSATLDAKYDNSYIVRAILPEAIYNIFSLVNMTADNPVVIRHRISLVAGQEYYQLPPAVQSVLRFGQVDTQGIVTSDFKPRNEMHPSGPGWILDGNTMRFDPFPRVSEDWDLWYTPSMNVPFHYAEDGVVNATSNATQLTLSSSPLLGSAAHFENELVGQMVRILEGPVWYERVIATHNVATRVITFRSPIAATTALSGTTGISYEVCPAGITPFWAAVAAEASHILGLAMKMAPEHLNNLLLRRRAALKTVRDNLSNLQLRTGKSVNKLTIDHPDAMLIFPGILRGP